MGEVLAGCLGCSELVRPPDDPAEKPLLYRAQDGNAASRCCTVPAISTRPASSYAASSGR